MRQDNTDAEDPGTPTVERDGANAETRDSGRECYESVVTFRDCLTYPQMGTWCGHDSSERTDFLEEVSKSYMSRIEEFYASADLSVDWFRRLSNSHTRWRRMVIAGTGVVAISAVMAAIVVSRGQSLAFAYSFWSAVGAAVLAALLAVLANLENFSNSAERAQGYRESRELFVDAAREFQLMWQTHVDPFYPEAQACLNAAELQRRINIKDSELRSKLKDMTKNARM